ncbi:MAG: XdhC family protein [Acidimicrobiia bacterium]
MANDDLAVAEAAGGARQAQVEARAVANDDLAVAEAALRGARQAHVKATVVATAGTVSSRPGDKALVTADGRLRGWVGGSCTEPAVVRAARQVLSDGPPVLLHLGPPGGLPEPAEGLAVAPVSCASQGTIQVFLEPWSPPPRVVAVGRAPLVRALVTMATAVGWEAVVVEREALDPAEAASFGVPVVPALDLAEAGVGPDTYVLVATMGRYDEDAVEAALATGARWVAMVGSSRRAATVVDALRASGVPEDRLARLQSPAGVDLGDLPHVEIAVSVLAAMVAHKASAWTAPAPVAAAEVPGEPGSEALDPVCGMTVQVEGATPSAEHAGTTFWFCCAGCRRRFERDPDRYLVAT